MLQIPIEKHTLKNGLRVILSPDRSAPVVTTYLVYDVGARLEERGRTGFAHLFEHMMFQGSENAPKGTHFKVVESNGGSLNGSTHPDYTDYFEILPSNKLPVALWLESDRMRALAITAESLANQKEAVKQERRLSFDNQPYATAIVDRWPELVYRNWQNAHSLIGSFEDLDAASVEDVAKFFRTYYAPNNAVLAIAGDIQPEETLRLVETYFGDIPPQPQPQRPDLSEPEQAEPRSLVYNDPLAKVPAVIVGYPGPKRRSADFNALVMLDVLLTSGDSSRFYQNLVKGRKSVVQYEANLGWPFSSPVDYRDPGVYAMYFLHHPNYTGRNIVAQAEEEIAKLRYDVPEAELARARTYLRASRIRQLQSTRVRAALLAQFELIDGRAEYINTELDEFLAVSPDDISGVATRYFLPHRKTVLEIVPGATEPSEVMR